MSISGFFQGSSAFAADRAQLSAAQLDALSGLRVIPTPGGGAADAVTVRLTVLDADGSSQTYRAVEGDVYDGDQTDTADAPPTIGYGSLVQFIDTVLCPASEDPDAGDDAGAEASAPPSDTHCVSRAFSSSP